VFELAQRRLEWADQRQVVLAQNVANANTPHYRPGDLPPFAKTLAESGLARAARLTQTQEMHIPGTVSGAALDPSLQQDVHAPDGNGVSLDKELGRIADTQSAQTIALNLYGKYASFFRLTLGRTS